jgi:hypothetical protein
MFHRSEGEPRTALAREGIEGSRAPVDNLADVLEFRAPRVGTSKRSCVEVRHFLGKFNEKKFRRGASIDARKLLTANQQRVQ